MPQGPRGGPRPMASSSLNVTVEVNAPDEGGIPEMIAHNLTSRFRYVEEITVSEETETIGGEMFDKVVAQLLFESNKIELTTVEDVASDIEDAIGEERIGVTIEAV